MATKIQLRRDTATNWATTNPVLSQGEAGYDITNGILKIGNGLTAWNGLQGISGSTGGIQGAQGTQGISGSAVAQGIQGFQGVQGNDGAGEQGIQGIIGEQGIQGIQGTQGTQGITGNQGGITYNVTVQGSTEYLINGVVNPPLNLIRGMKYFFNVNTFGQPFYIKTAATAGSEDQYNDGVTNNGVEVGVLTFEVPFNAPTELFYVSQNQDPGIFGTITTAEFGAGAGSGTQGAQGIQGIAGSGIQGVQGIQGITGSGTQGIQGAQGTSGAQGVQGLSGATVTPLGRTFYVSKNGDDEDNDGLTPGSAFSTIKNALTQMLSGETLLVASGTYEEAYPLTAPANITVRGAGIRATIIKPTAGTDANDGWEIFGSTTFSDFTMLGQYWDEEQNEGYAFRIRPGANWSERSPYLERITILNKGRDPVLPSDPYGFNSTGNGNVAGRGIFIDGKDVSSSSPQAAILLNEITMFVPNSIGIRMKNGARCETLNSFVYFADKAVLLEEGAEGIHGDGKTRIKVSGVTNMYTPTAGHTMTVYDSGSTMLGLTIESYDVDTNTIVIDGKVNGLIEGSNDIRFVDVDIEQAVATAITLVDYKDFGAEFRSIANAYVYGNHGIYADGDGIQANLISHNFAYIGAGANTDNDTDLSIPANEVTVLNGAKVFVSSVDQDGEFRIGLSDRSWYFNNLGDLEAAGNIIPDTDNAYNLGSPTNQWKHVYTAGGSIYLDNIKLTNNNGKLEVTKVINAGGEDETPDPEDSNAASNIGGGDNSYTPEDTDHWNDPAVNTVQEALDELAARVTALQNLEIDGGNAYTPPQGELLIDGNGA